MGPEMAFWKHGEAQWWNERERMIAEVEGSSERDIIFVGAETTGPLSANVETGGGLGAPFPAPTCSSIGLRRARRGLGTKRSASSAAPSRTFWRSSGKSDSCTWVPARVATPM